MRAAHRHLDERRVGQKAREDVVLVLISLVFGIGKEARVLPDTPSNWAVELAVSLGDGEELFRMRHWEEPQSGAIENSENAGVHAHAERQREHRDGREAWILDQHSPAKPQVVQQHFQYWQSSALPNHLFRLLDPAELHKRFPAPLSAAHAPTQIVFDVHLEMAFHLGGEFPLSPCSPEESAQPQQPSTYAPHADSFPGARNRARISVVFSH